MSTPGNTTIHLFYTKFSEALNPSAYQKHLAAIPPCLQAKTLRYQRWQDRQAHLLGKILLKQALVYYGFEDDCLHHLCYNSHNRPYIADDIDFNISHSCGYVMCAIGRQVRLGVDVEAVRNINLDDFYEVMSPPQWHTIRNAEDPIVSFFSYWTIKEAVVKADTRGLTLPMDRICIQPNHVRCEGQIWYVKPIAVEQGYRAYLAANRQHCRISSHYADLNTY